MLKTKIDKLSKVSTDVIKATTKNQEQIGIGQLPILECIIPIGSTDPIGNHYFLEDLMPIHILSTLNVNQSLQDIINYYEYWDFVEYNGVSIKKSLLTTVAIYNKLSFQQTLFSIFTNLGLESDIQYFKHLLFSFRNVKCNTTKAFEAFYAERIWEVKRVSEQINKVPLNQWGDLNSLKLLNMYFSLLSELENSLMTIMMSFDCMPTEISDEDVDNVLDSENLNQ